MMYVHQSTAREGGDVNVIPIRGPGLAARRARPRIITEPRRTAHGPHR